MNYEDQYKQEAVIFAKIVKKYEDIQENDIMGAYKLMKDSLQAYNRWSKIRHDIRKECGRGCKPELKDRLEEMCRYLKEINQECRMIWNSAKDDYNNNVEG